MIEFLPIEYAKNPFEQIDNVPVQGAGISKDIGELILNEKYMLGLDDLNGFSHIYIVFHIHKSEGYELKMKPFLDNEHKGIFATRSPRRPNAIGLSIIEIERIERIEANRIFVRGIDLLNGTPILDIKPYIQSFDNIKNTRDGWYERGLDPLTVLSDKRFT
ncbi:tRNA (N6-threonylcarbamoyladenosine(37)-N6)-methyltransferase TrmO [Shewanella sp. D64]|uniref:tRNA (N6-threonylcarbamoyladenosine(37)-N6)-methyltransferase TrmO n=1 Tax=unclassified Shewanella TaxID=196818 RepID=UPI0022BA2677|nr:MULTISPECIES: tRNA (N6-threonylcarbamoyladenosine(37)-N6)-methyltransferase TrmO [unclassified Shewanella]MEC4729034.1 tRNA (N6-threonylcarbamoyladenosine(37)-N6)-methyltransferase TrmO [Shewanella sp. D64]MEC4739891.1 tRNA (N6-threonylcarbamoyladenosine(37)-N6)-methyltransferase TrmO [Shewanella sp. E94]WBJ97143.1 tRNA (N6-threonylcarbamoyladenosine(37)-N6)-methyltransferase TrmO [Shewanella sp. MTB7]